MRNADLHGADLTGTRLFRTDLGWANLSGATLRNARLQEANLHRAIGITNEQVEQQTLNLRDATMPNGQKYEDWLKSKGSGEDGENTGPS